MEGVFKIHRSEIFVELLEKGDLMKKILIVGATSAIARETARCFAAAGDALFLVARNAAKLEAETADLKARGASRVWHCASRAYRMSPPTVASKRST